ncbi:MAG: hypothetical protein AB7H80_14450, partial [Candidatus Kapaibacterium sp.]
RSSGWRDGTDIGGNTDVCLHYGRVAAVLTAILPCRILALIPRSAGGAGSIAKRGVPLFAMPVGIEQKYGGIESLKNLSERERVEV